MRQFLRSLLRIGAALTVVITVMAVVLGRVSSHPEGARWMESPRYEPISAHLYPEVDPSLGPRMLNLVTGAIERVRLFTKDRLAYGSCSPWRDGLGRTHVVGLWRSDEFGEHQPMGLLRVSLPDGEVLDRVEAENMPNSPPCWFPGTRSRILYAGWDGILYTFSFEDLSAGPESQPAPGEEPVDLMKPRAITWRKPPVAGPRPLIADPTWPTDPLLNGKLIVSLTFIEPNIAEEDRQRSQLWWLQLNAAGTEIVDAGRLIEPRLETRPDVVLEERLPRVAAAPDGSLALGYLIRKSGKLDVSLRLGRLSVDKATGVPSIDERNVVDVADGCTTAPPAFSCDGTTVFSLPRATHAPAAAQPHRVAAVLARLPQSEDRALARGAAPAEPKPHRPSASGRDRRHLSWNDSAAPGRRSRVPGSHRNREISKRPSRAG